MSWDEKSLNFAIWAHWKIAVREDQRELPERYALSDEEARILVGLFGPDDCFGLEWSLVGLVETAPGWLLADCNENTDNEWIQLLRQRVNNAAPH
jgi:hypothetical protein